ncbi:hypothetical protein MUK42_16227 [Musa troglodytarum]|uniref:Uncharacterized protein n=1 Tax=Musa troglodytarum TaxID=320322 RepID=A0A9E7H996_9LILI|nr:hypothetical protein MUK42_16227 [Musa troglodytarum]
MAGDHTGRQLQRRWVRSEAGPVRRLQGPGRVVRPDLGPDRMLGGDARHARRVHPHRLELLRRQPRRRLQPAGGGDAGQCAGRQLQLRRLRRRPATDLPLGAGRQGRQGDGGVPERVRRVRHRPVLLPRRVRERGHVPADVLFQDVQDGVPGGVQLRVRRPVQHLHLQPGRLHRHLLLQQVNERTNALRCLDASVSESRDDGLTVASLQEE